MPMWVLRGRGGSKVTAAAERCACCRLQPTHRATLPCSTLHLQTVLAGLSSQCGGNISAADLTAAAKAAFGKDVWLTCSPECAGVQLH